MHSWWGSGNLLSYTEGHLCTQLCRYKLSLDTIRALCSESVQRWYHCTYMNELKSPMTEFMEDEYTRVECLFVVKRSQRWESIHCTVCRPLQQNCFVKPLECRIVSLPSGSEVIHPVRTAQTVHNVIPEWITVVRPPVGYKCQVQEIFMI